MHQIFRIWSLHVFMLSNMIFVQHMCVPMYELCSINLLCFIMLQIYLFIRAMFFFKYMFSEKKWIKFLVPLFLRKWNPCWDLASNYYPWNIVLFSQWKGMFSNPRQTVTSDIGSWRYVVVAFAAGLAIIAFPFSSHNADFQTSIHQSTACFGFTFTNLCPSLDNTGDS